MLDSWLCRHSLKVINNNYSYIQIKSIFRRNLTLINYQLEYVKRVIAQSGAAVADWAFVRNPLFMRNTSVVAGYSYGCRTRHTFNLVECLKSRSAIDFTTTEVKVNKMDFILTFIKKTRRLCNFAK